VVAGVGQSVESNAPQRPRGEPTVSLRLLGELTLVCGENTLPLLASRKVRALIAYLALAPHPVTRSRLCELLWDVPNDPRGELRWCLSKVRNVLDGTGRKRVLTHGETIAFDLSDCFVDALEIARVTATGVERFTTERLKEACSLFSSEFLDGLEVESSLEFNGWLLSQRRRFRSRHTAMLERLAQSAPAAHVFEYLEKWLSLAPFDRRAHEALLRHLAQRGRLREAQEHVAAAVRLFDAEGLDGSSISEAWRAASAAGGSVTPSRNSADEIGRETPRRASVAVMPFVDRTRAVQTRDPADGLAHDVITRLAKLRSMFVIAQGSVFALHERGVDPQEAARTLNVDYFVSGSIRRQAKRLSVMVELTETRSARMVWTEEFEQAHEEAFLMPGEIGDKIVASIASEIEASERNRAILRPPASLDAWEAHHRGLWHMYRFNRADNDRAQQFFEMAVRLDPTFARAYAGLSFTHFQNAFQGWTVRERESDLAFESAGQSLLADDHDPAAHWAMGRALWLRGRQGDSLNELERAVDLSPNFAVAHYTLAFVLSQSGDPEAAIRAADYSRNLSPFDPLLFGILASRAMAHVRLGQVDEAASWALKAAARPNAHAHIRAIAAYSLALAERRDEARALTAEIRRTNPYYGVDDFLTAFHFDADGTALYRRAAKRIGE
jgi:DNA-binding SARP family transcriptional activator/TolB-like protein